MLAPWNLVCSLVWQASVGVVYWNKTTLEELKNERRCIVSSLFVSGELPVLRHGSDTTYANINDIFDHLRKNVSRFTLLKFQLLVEIKFAFEHCQQGNFLPQEITSFLFAEYGNRL